MEEDPLASIRLQANNKLQQAAPQALLRPQAIRFRLHRSNPIPVRHTRWHGHKIEEDLNEEEEEIDPLEEVDLDPGEEKEDQIGRAHV